MKTYFQLIALVLLSCIAFPGCQDNENWRIIPYEPEVIEGPEHLYVVGAHQGWKPDAEIIGKIYPIDTDGNYGGFVFLNGEFKCTTQPNWEGPNYGLGSGEGNLSTEEDAGNLTATEGYYYLTLNIKDLTYQIEARNFGVIGSATPGGWNTDTDLTYDSNDLKLKTTIELTEGEIKFRANDAWDIPNGDFGMGETEGSLKQKGDNISVGTGGNYQIIVDLTTPEYSYELVKQ